MSTVQHGDGLQVISGRQGSELRQVHVVQLSCHRHVYQCMAGCTVDRGRAAVCVCVTDSVCVQCETML